MKNKRAAAGSRGRWGSRLGTENGGELRVLVGGQRTQAWESKYCSRGRSGSRDSRTTGLLGGSRSQNRRKGMGREAVGEDGC